MHQHHYRNDLKKLTEVEEDKVIVETLPRYILMNNEDIYKMLFNLLDIGGDVSKEVWKLINNLPTSPITMEKVLKLQGIKNEEKPDW